MYISNLVWTVISNDNSNDRAINAIFTIIERVHTESKYSYI